MKVNWYALIGWLLAVGIILGLIFHHPKPVTAPVTEPPTVVEPPLPPPMPDPPKPEVKKKPPIVKKKPLERRYTAACKGIPEEAYTLEWSVTRYIALNRGATKGQMQRLCWCLGRKYDGSGR